MKLVTIATCNLNQWALDFEGNLERIRESVRQAKLQGATIRIGPELEICGYGCEDHFLESDTILHSWEVLRELLADDTTENIICDFGMPVVHRDVRYNCRVVCCNHKIVLIRPKLFMADDGNYRETRYFTPWRIRQGIEDHYLPRIIGSVTNQVTVPFGEGVVSTADTCIGAETCEELFTPDSPHIAMSLDGVEIITNGSGSHHQLRKLQKRYDLIMGATSKNGGVYVYANQIGCDGGRLYFDGCAMISLNDGIVAQGSQFSLAEVEVVTAKVDLEEVRSYRTAISSRSQQATSCKRFPRVHVDFRVSRDDFITCPSPVTKLKIHDPMEEIALGPAIWLWDYLRRSSLAGYFLALSGGADSTTVAALVGSMCQLLHKEVVNNNKTIIAQLQKICNQNNDWKPASSQEIAGHILHTCYMGTLHSSNETNDRAKAIATEIGCYHLSFKIDSVIDALVALFQTVTQRRPIFRSQGGTNAENLALQNIQARLRMVISYLFAQLLPWVRGKPGSLLVLGTSNVDEALRGYYTKYDCSAADINPIGSISKTDLKAFMKWGAHHLGYPSMIQVMEAAPTAELEPTTQEYKQTDEIDMGMTYDELGVYGRLRKLSRLGPFSMFTSLVLQWPSLGPTKVAEKVKFFFKMYAINRHKMTTLTPSYHAESYSPDDNRHDLRQFLYNANWPWQFGRIDEYVKKMEAAKQQKQE